MESLQHTAVRALSAALSDQPTTEAKVVCAFRIVAGPSLARATAGRWTSDGVLRLAAKDPTWRRELERGRAIIERRLTEFLGPGIVKRLIIERNV